MIAAIAAAVDAFPAPWIILDGIDQLLQHHADPADAIDQIRRLNEECEKRGWSMLLTGKTSDDTVSPAHLEGVEYMLPTTIALLTLVRERRLERHLRIAKYRGSSHVTDTVAMIINDQGIQLPYQTRPESVREEVAGTERISTGVERLDQLLDGGIYRGSSLLISGRPGTAKSTLCASMAKASSNREERALYISFDELQGAFVRNLRSVGIDLQPSIEGNLVRFLALSANSALVAEHVLNIQQQIEEFRPHLILIDPVSALIRAENRDAAQRAVEQLLDLAHARGVTTVMTSLTDDEDPQGESTLTHVSTIADTWIVLDYSVRAGERNRSISIVKSRGSAHSNQQRELVLSREGITLADVYEFGTEVLMGTARAQKEIKEDIARERRALQRKARSLDLGRRITQAQAELERLETELQLEKQQSEEMDRMDDQYSQTMRSRRESSQAESGKGETQ